LPRGNNWLAAVNLSLAKKNRKILRTLESISR